MKWLDVAWAEVGVQETSGSAATPAILAYFRDAGRPDITSDEVAWCAAFVGACLERAGIAQTIPPAEALLARSFLTVGQAIAEPRMGCIAVLSRGSDPRAGHVGFVVGWTDADIVLLGGNQSNRVSTQHFPRARLLAQGLRWPGPAVTPKELEQSGSRIARATARQKRDAAKTIGIEAVPDDAVAAAGAALGPAAPPPADALALPPSLPAPSELAAGASALQATVEALSSFAVFAAAKWPWITAGIALYWVARMAWDAWQAREARVEDARTGKTS